MMEEEEDEHKYEDVELPKPIAAEQSVDTVSKQQPAVARGS